MFYEKELESGKDRVSQINHQVKNIDDNGSMLTVIQDNIQEAYKGMDLLIEYGQTNAQIFRKVVRTWDSNNHQAQHGKQIIQNKLMQHDFSEPLQVEALKNQLEQQMAKLLNIEPKEAKQQLQSVYKAGKTLKQKTNMLLGAGFSSAVALMVFMVFLHAVFYYPSLSNKTYLDIGITNSMMKLLKSQFLIAVCVISFGFMVKACERYNINYPYLLEFPSEA